jgi:AcrR family transcriptional regulator
VAERADAARNRRAILQATEDLLTRFRPEEISMEQVAAAAGVGKGTVFHRFGNRLGLMTALMQERAYALQEAVENGPPPLGAGAPAGERLLAFFDAVVDVVARNKGLLAALGHAVSAAPRPDHGDDDHGDDGHPLHRAWRAHVQALLAAERPGLDAEAAADVLLGALTSDPVLRMFERGEGERVAAVVHAVVEALLRGPDPVVE